MLEAIFQRLQQLLVAALQQKQIPASVIVGALGPSNPAESSLLLALHEFGPDPILQYHTLPPETDGKNPNTSHLLTFHVIPESHRYLELLRLVEFVVMFFDEHPFIDVSTEHTSYEVAISMKAITANDYSQFWLSRQEKSQPVIFYQARISVV